MSSQAFVREYEEKGSSDETCIIGVVGISEVGKEESVSVTDGSGSGDGKSSSANTRVGLA